jgi:hypothetical protein
MTALEFELLVAVAVLGGIAVIALYTYLIATPRNDDERVEDREHRREWFHARALRRLKEMGRRRRV